MGRPPPLHSAPPISLWKWPLVVGGLGLLLTACIAWLAWRESVARDAARFESSVARTNAALEARVESYIALLRAGTGFYAGSGVPSRREFEIFVERIDLPRNYPGVQGIGFAQRVTSAAREAFEEDIRRTVNPEFALFPNGHHDEYFPVVFLEPMDRRNREAIGFDMFSEPARRDAMRRACDLGQPAASRRVVLVQEIDPAKQAGFLIYLPVYRAGTIPLTIEARRETLLGFIYSPFRAGDLLSGILRVEHTPGIGFEVFDGRSPGDLDFLYRSPVEPSPRPAFFADSHLQVADRYWTIRYGTTPAFASGSSRPWVGGVLVSGLLVSGLLAGITLELTRAVARSRQRTQELFTEQERFRFMAESMPQKIFTAQPDGRVDYFNQQWMAFTGLRMEQIRGRGWLRFMHPEDREENIRRWRHALASGQSLEVEHRFRRHDGTYHWHLTRAHALREPDGRVRLWIGSSTDIEEQKRSEERLEQTVVDRTGALIEANEQLEAFVYSIAHDLRAPLRSLSGFAQVLREDSYAVLSASSRDMLQRIQGSAEFMDRLILDLLAFGRTARAEIELGPVQVCDAWAIAQAQTSGQIEQAGAEIETVEPLPVVRAHEATLGQVLANLLSNALKFVAPGVRPRVRFWSEDQGRIVRLWVEDNGIGIPPEMQERVFRVFERLHGTRYAGTGIGLSIVRKGIERMGGKVGVGSDGRSGTRFWIELQKP